MTDRQASAAMDAEPAPERPIGLANGYYQVAPGKLVNAVTWLEMLDRPPSPIAKPLRLVFADHTNRDAVRALFVEIGTPWLWSRAYDNEDIPAGAFLALDDAARAVGLVELASAKPNETEIVYFGLIPGALGGGLGRRLMAAALERAWQDAKRVWLHTCSFDHPAALKFYRSCGFIPYASGFEIMDDPRRDGRLPRDAAPHVPMIVGS